MTDHDNTYILTVEKWLNTSHWTFLREVKVTAVKVTAKRIYIKHGAMDRVFDKETGNEIKNRSTRIFSSYRFSVKMEAQ